MEAYLRLHSELANQLAHKKRDPPKLVGNRTHRIVPLARGHRRAEPSVSPEPLQLMEVEQQTFESIAWEENVRDELSGSPDTVPSLRHRHRFRGVSAG